MTRSDPSGNAQLNPAYLSRWALVAGQDHAARSGQLHDGRLWSWV
jgi:hypothetical protein